MKPNPWPPLLAALLMVLLTGCDTMTFSQYSGGDRVWPTGSAFTEGVFAVPVYRGWPEKPYTVLGLVQFENPNVDWNRGDMMQAAKKAQAAGGDALILLPKGADPSPTVTETRKQFGITGDHTVGVVVKWK
ncbi:MAG: hypothetical protein M5U12_07165 [Verrucomicrobia bacterium]|nr:hypothetical protein [Verrucomicrobiota bacterium]